MRVLTAALSLVSSLLFMVALAEPWAAISFYSLENCAGPVSRLAYNPTGCIVDGQSKSSLISCNSDDPAAEAQRREYNSEACLDPPSMSFNVPQAPSCFALGDSIFLKISCRNEPGTPPSGSVVQRQFSSGECEPGTETLISIAQGCQRDEQNSLSFSLLSCNESGIFESSVLYSTLPPSPMISDGRACQKEAALSFDSLANFTFSDRTAETNCEPRGYTDADGSEIIFASEIWSCHNVDIQTSSPTVAPTPLPPVPTPAPPTPQPEYTESPTVSPDVSDTIAPPSFSTLSSYAMAPFSGPSTTASPAANRDIDPVFLTIAIAGPLLLGALCIGAWICWVRRRGERLELVPPKEIPRRLTRTVSNSVRLVTGSSGNLHQITAKPSVPSEPLETLEGQVPYYGALDGHGATALLSTQERGAFLLRDNVEVPNDRQHPRVLSFVDHASGEVAHLPLRHAVDESGKSLGGPWAKAGSSVEHAALIALLAWLPLGLRLNWVKSTPHYKTTAFTAMTIRRKKAAKSIEAEISTKAAGSQHSQQQSLLRAVSDDGRGKDKESSSSSGPRHIESKNSSRSIRQNDTEKSSVRLTDGRSGTDGRHRANSSSNLHRSRRSRSGTVNEEKKQ